MSATGILIIIIAIFIILNANKLGWIMMGRMKLNTEGYGGGQSTFPNPSPPHSR
jgi:hypothetical protein